MLRRLLALVAVLCVSVSASPALAYDPTLFPGVTYQPMSSSPLATPFSFNNSPYNPGGPLTAPLLNNWLYWGNPFNWLSTGNPYSYSSYGYSYGSPYAAYSSSGYNRVAYGTYTTGANNGGQMGVANYTNAPGASGLASSVATYTDSSADRSMGAGAYTNAATSMQTPVATYTNTASTRNMGTAAYTNVPAASDKMGTAAYTSAVNSRSMGTAAYTTAAAASQPTANYTPASAATNTAIWPGTRSSVRGTQPVANYTPSSSTGGAAFGSLFGDGRDPAFEGSAIQAFVARLRGQTAPTYTSRVEDLSNRNYGAYFDVNPVTTYTPAPNYDSAFPVTNYGNLNSTPVTVTTVPGAINNAAVDSSLSAPLVQSSTYQADLRILQTRGVLPPSWTTRAESTLLQRRDLATLTARLRHWRETGVAVPSVWPDPSFSQLLPVITDLADTDPAYRAFMYVASQRVLYMPNLIENQGQVVSAASDANGVAQRGQGLQAIMAALYLRPRTDYSNAGYTDLPKDAWYTQWALSARALGLDFGNRFAYDTTMTQAEAVHITAVMLQQFR